MPPCLCPDQVPVKTKVSKIRGICEEVQSLLFPVPKSYPVTQIQ